MDRRGCHELDRIFFDYFLNRKGSIDRTIVGSMKIGRKMVECCGAAFYYPRAGLGPLGGTSEARKC